MGLKAEGALVETTLPQYNPSMTYRCESHAWEPQVAWKGGHRSEAQGPHQPWGRLPPPTPPRPSPGQTTFTFSRTQNSSLGLESALICDTGGVF